MDKLSVGLLGLACLFYLLSVARVAKEGSRLIVWAFVLHLLGLLIQLFVRPARFGFAQAL